MHCAMFLKYYCVISYCKFRLNYFFLSIFFLSEGFILCLHIFYSTNNKKNNELHVTFLYIICDSVSIGSHYNYN